MNIYRIVIIIIFILTLAGNASAQKLEKPETIPAVTEALKKAADPGNAEKIPAMAKDVAASYGRKAIPQLLAALFGGKPEDGVHELVGRTLIEMTGPEDRFGLRKVCGTLGADIPLAAPELTAASLAALQERDRLLQIVSGREWRSAAAVDAAGYAAGFLRVLGNTGTIEKAASFLQETGLPKGFIQHLQSLTASLAFRFDTLKSQKDRDAYLKFEKHLWWSLAVTPKGHLDSTYLTRKSAGNIREKLGDIDPRFLTRILDEPASSGIEKDVAFFLIAAQKETKLKDKLKSIAASGSEDAATAKWVLSELEKKE